MNFKRLRNAIDTGSDTDYLLVSRNKLSKLVDRHDRLVVGIDLMQTQVDAVVHNNLELYTSNQDLELKLVRLQQIVDARVLAPVQQPLTLSEMFVATVGFGHVRSDYMTGIARAIEAAHGIKDLSFPANGSV